MKVNHFNSKILTSPKKNHITKNHYLAAASLLIVFILDIFTPTEFVADILYLSCIVIVFKENTRTIISFSIAACLLIVIDMAFFDLKLNPSVSHIINRIMSVFAILITSYIAVHYRRVRQAGILKEKQYLKALEEMLFMTSHQIRKPVANILGLIEVINTCSNTLPAPDLKRHYQYLNCSAKELDNFIKELNAFIEQTEQQSQANAPIHPSIRIFASGHHKVYPNDTVLKAMIS